jgi:2-iminobutanoate/2-iminopropanoate deaminase
MRYVNFFGLIACFCYLALQETRKSVVYEHNRNGLPFSKSVRMGDMVILSGQIGAYQDENGQFRAVPGGIKAESKQAFDIIEGSLAFHGMTKKNIVKCLIMLADIQKWQEFNSVYLEWLGEHRPARSAFGSSGLALSAEIELECIAHR